MSLLEGKTAIVTGASRGIGKAIAIDLAKNGCKVAINYHTNKRAAEEVLRETENYKTGNFTYKADVSIMEQAESLFAEAADRFGKVDILVNNAGITRDTLLIRMKESDWDEVLNTNLKGAFNCLQAAARLMIKNKSGRIINISSVIGLEGNAGQVNYASAKAGLIGLTFAAAKELGSRNITVNAVAPGFIETDMTASLDEKKLEQITDYITLKRLGKPEDIASMVTFLASEKASYVTGQVIRVDGGIIL